MEIDGGYIPLGKKKKKSHYQKVSEAKQKKLFRGMKFVQIEMDRQLAKAQNCLKRINTIEARSKIEMKKYGHTSTTVALGRYKRLAAFNFFVTMIGYIDSKIKYERGKIEFLSHFTVIDDAYNDSSHYDEIGLRNDIIAGYLVDREEVLDGLRSFMENDYDTKEIIDDVLNEAPSYLNFGKLYENCEKDIGKLELISDLVSAYNIGLVTMDYYGTDNNYEDRLNRYRSLFSNLTIHVNTNDAELNNVKVKKK